MPEGQCGMLGWKENVRKEPLPLVELIILVETVHIPSCNNHRPRAVVREVRSQQWLEPRREERVMYICLAMTGRPTANVERKMKLSNSVIGETSRSSTLFSPLHSICGASDCLSCTSKSQPIAITIRLGLLLVTAFQPPPCVPIVRCLTLFGA